MIFIIQGSVTLSNGRAIFYRKHICLLSKKTLCKLPAKKFNSVREVSNPCRARQGTTASLLISREGLCPAVGVIVIIY